MKNIFHKKNVKIFNAFLTGFNADRFHISICSAHAYYFSISEFIKNFVIIYIQIYIKINNKLDENEVASNNIICSHSKFLNFIPLLHVTNEGFCKSFLLFP